MEKEKNITIDHIRQWIDGQESSSEEEVVATEKALHRFAEAGSLEPGTAMRAAILEKMALLNRQKKEQHGFSLDNLPMLSADANWLDWREAVKNIEPAEEFDNIYMHPLEVNDKYELYILWVKNYVEEEVHHDVRESFVLLEGSCECLITDQDGNARKVWLREGDHIEMILGENHDITVTSAGTAKAILQWVKLAA